MGRVGTNGGVAPPATLLRAAPVWGASPRRPTLFSHLRIIYDGNERINNSHNHKNTPPRRRGAAPPGEARRSVAGGATPPLDNTRVLTFYEFVLVFKPFLRENFRNSSFTILHRRIKVIG